MNKKEKIEFITSITNNLQESLLSLVDRLPEEWDGHELRPWIKEYYETHYIFGSKLKGNRKTDYKNDLIVKNLI